MRHQFGPPNPCRLAISACYFQAGAMAALLMALGVIVPAVFTGQTATAEPPAAAAEAAAKPGEKGEKAAEKPAKKKSSSVVAQITLAGSMPDGVGQGGLLADV